MTDLPPPPVPADANLTDFPGMQIDVVRLLHSDLMTREGAIVKVALRSWCEAWHQVPAGSLPNDDSKLSRLLGFDGVANFRRFRAAGKLLGWVLHADGRLYHPVVTETVQAALRLKHKHRSRTSAATAARQQEATRPPRGQGGGQGGQHPRPQGGGQGGQLANSAANSTDGADVTLNVTWTKGREVREEEESALLVGDSVAARKAFDALFGAGVAEGGDEAFEQDEPPAEPARGSRPYMPSLGDPEHRWAHFATSTEIDPRSMKGESVHYRGAWAIRKIALMVADAVGWYASNIRPDWTPLLRWIDDGLDPHDHILPTIRRIMARQGGGSAVASLAYFDRAVRETANGGRRTG